MIAWTAWILIMPLILEVLEIIYYVDEDDDKQIDNGSLGLGFYLKIINF